MEELKDRYTEYAFIGGRDIPSALSTVNVIDMGLTGYNGENLVRIRTNSPNAVLLSDDPQNKPNVVYLYGTDNYDGLRRIHSKLDARQFIFPSSYVAETLDGTETVGVGFKASFPSIFGGFTIHLDAPSATSENLEIINYSARDSAFNNLLYSKDMDGVQDINYMFSPPRFLSPNDRIDITWANTNAKTWGISLYIREL